MIFEKYPIKFLGNTYLFDLQVTTWGEVTDATFIEELGKEGYVKTEIVLLLSHFLSYRVILSNLGITEDSSLSKLKNELKRNFVHALGSIPASEKKHIKNSWIARLYDRIQKSMPIDSTSSEFYGYVGLGYILMGESKSKIIEGFDFLKVYRIFDGNRIIRELISYFSDTGILRAAYRTLTSYNYGEKEYFFYLKEKFEKENAEEMKVCFFQGIAHNSTSEAVEYLIDYYHNNKSNIIPRYSLIILRTLRDLKIQNERIAQIVALESMNFGAPSQGYAIDFLVEKKMSLESIIRQAYSKLKYGNTQEKEKAIKVLWYSENCSTGPSVKDILDVYLFDSKLREIYSLKFTISNILYKRFTKDLPDIIIKYTECEDEEVSNRAILALGMLQGRTIDNSGFIIIYSNYLRNRLNELSSSSNVDIRINAFNRLYMIAVSDGNSKEIDNFFEFSGKSSSAYELQIILNLIAGLIKEFGYDSKYDKQFLRFLSHENWEVRKAVIRSLKYSSDSLLRDIVESMQSDPSSEIRKFLAERLVRRDDKYAQIFKILDDLAIERPLPRDREKTSHQVS